MEAATAAPPANGTGPQDPDDVAQEPEEPTPVLGGMTLFLPDDYEVKKLGVTLGGITIEDDGEFQGRKLGDELDLVIRGAKVTGAKPTHKGEVTLILHADNIGVL